MSVGLALIDNGRVAVPRATVHCDEPGCDRTIRSRHVTKDAARDAAAGADWDRIGDRDFCPWHGPWPVRSDR